MLFQYATKYLICYNMVIKSHNNEENSMQNKRHISILMVAVIAIMLFVGCGEVQQTHPNYTATPIPAQIEKPIRYDDKEEELPMDPEFAKMRIPSQERFWGFKDVMGNWVIEPNYIRVHDFKEGLAAVATVRDGEEYWGYVNETGREVIETKYSYIRDFSNGLAFVREKSIDGTLSNSYIDTDGVDVIELDTDITEGFEFDDEGMAIVYKRDGENSRYGVIDRDGNFLIPFDKGFWSISKMSGKYFSAIPAMPVDGNQKYGLIDAKGEWIIEPKYDEVQVLGDDRILVGIEGEKGQKCEIISFNGEVISNLGYGCPQLLGEYPIALVYDMFVFHRDGEDMPQLKLYDIDGNQLLEGKTYESILILSQDMIFVDDPNGSYLVNKAGEKIVDIDVPYAPRCITEEIIKVPTNNKIGVYNIKQNIWIANPIYERILYYNGTQGEAIRDVKKADGNVTFVIDTFDNKGEVHTTRGETMIESEYDEMVKN